MNTTLQVGIEILRCQINVEQIKTGSHTIPYDGNRVLRCLSGNDFI